ncbi:MULTISPECIES: hypothetical protein [unclassified Nonomuraea]|uniref:hypothetical protein n=1 Tax=unclassified Nonomuraea TaxID=2593643 RepID=UPI0033C7C32F
MKEHFAGRDIEVIDFQDVVAGEHVIEFRDTAWRRNEAILAISVPDDGSWDDAMISVNPHKGDVSVSFATWAIVIARKRLAD